MSITRAEQMSMKPVLAADSVGVSAASVVMPGGIGVSSSSVRPRAGGGGTTTAEPLGKGAGRL
ncbi:hypothetical protein GCM10010527_40290 [Streptomyces drozdowiczii]